MTVPYQSPPDSSEDNVQVAPLNNDSRPSRYAKAMLVTIVVVALAATVTFLVQNKTGSGTLQLARVDVSGSQFSPATLLIKPGTTVAWTNNDQAAHQVAADPFPKDNSIPGFDSGVVIQPHDTYSYTFVKKGTYTYHDEKNPFQLQGTIVVQ